MANYHFEVQPIQRSKGQSAVAASAYRAAEKIMDEKTGILHDYTRKKDVLRSTILLPEGAPGIFTDRATLWNTVESIEKRKDAQPAREINIALPVEFTEAQNWDLIVSFVQKEFVALGMIADVAYHRGTSQSPNPHVHVMLTMRSVNEYGFGLKVRGWNSKALLKEWRTHWAEHCNQRYAELGFDLRIDERTLEAQGINLEPQNKRGAIEAGQRKARVLEHQAIARGNGERIAQDPHILLYALTRQQSTFTHHDIARLVNRHSADEAQFTAVYAAVLSSKELVHLGRDSHGLERFTTHEMMALEKKMVEQVEGLAREERHALFDKRLEAIMARYTLNEEQEVAVRHITLGKDVASVVGYAGTGKSYLLRAAREAWEEVGYRVQGMTLSGIAAQNLQASSGIQSRTIASHEWYWQKGLEHLTQNDIVVVDEAGMLGSEQMANIVSKVSDAEAKLVLIGDPEQLQAIAAGASFRAIHERTGFVSLTDIIRQKEAWQREATKQLATAKTNEALKAYGNKGYVHSREDKLSAMLAVIENWDEERGQGAGENSIMLAHTRRAVLELNAAARNLRQRQGELGEDCVIMTARGKRTFSAGDRIYFLENENKTLQVKNGTLATIEAIQGNTITACLDALAGEAPRKVTFSLKDYNNIDLGYAATIHKAQGVTVDRAYVLASGYMDRHLTYVALSRHREKCTLYYDTNEFKNFQDLCAQLGRERSKDVTLDYDLTPSALSDNKNATLDGFEIRRMFFEGYHEMDYKKEKTHIQNLHRINAEEQKMVSPWLPKTTLWAYDAAKEFVGYIEELNRVVQNGLFSSIAEPEKDALAKQAIEWYQDKNKRDYLFKHAKNLAATLQSLVISFETKQQELSTGNRNAMAEWFSGYDWFKEELPQDCEKMTRLLDIKAHAETTNHHYESKEDYRKRYEKAQEYMTALKEYESRELRHDEYWLEEDIKAMEEFSAQSKLITEDEAAMRSLNEIDPALGDRAMHYAYSIEKDIKQYVAQLERGLEQDDGRSY